MKKAVYTLILIAISLLILVGCTDRLTESGKIVVLYTGDMHCSVESGANKLDLAQLALYKQAVSNSADYVTLVDCGDAVQGSNIGTLTKGESIVELMNEVGYDVCTFGNHEFDYGIDQLEKLMGMSDAEYICCNFMDSDGCFVSPYTIRSYGELKIAYIGITTPYTLTSSNPEVFKDENGELKYSFCQDTSGEKLYNAVQNAVDTAIGMDADYVIALAHLGNGEGYSPYGSEDVIAATSGIDIVLDGHSHTVVESREVYNKEGEPVMLTSSGSHMQYIGQVTIDTRRTTGKNDDVITIRLIDSSDYDRVAGKTEETEKEFEEILGTEIGYTAKTLSVNSENGNRLVRNRETGIGNFVADAYRSLTNADIAFVNGGGIRADIPEGKITYGDLLNVQPYGNMICVVEATGLEIRDALEMSYRMVEGKYEDENGSVGESGGFFQLSGMKVVIDTSIPSGVKLDENGMFSGVEGERRVKEVYVLNGETGEYEPLSDSKTYTVASINYILLQGGDGFGMFMDNEVITSEAASELQAIIEYLELSGGNIEDRYFTTEGRITVLG